MWKRIKEFFGFSTEEKPQEESPIFVEADDPFMAMMVAEVFRTGKAHVGSVDEEGNFTMEPVEDKPE